MEHSWVLLLLLLLSARLQTCSADINDVQLYGGTFDARASVTYAQLQGKGCFSGMGLGTCAPPPTDGWLQDWMSSYNSIGATGSYCLSCCSNSAVKGGGQSNVDTWDLKCRLSSMTQTRFVNVFGWEFVFKRNKHEGDMEQVKCAIPRSACSYTANGQLAQSCSSDGSYLQGYTLTLGVRINATPLGPSRRQITYCSVTADETAIIPTSFRETIVMKHDPGHYQLAPWWGILIALAALGIVSAGMRYVRADACVVCGHNLIWLRIVCLPCRFYGYKMPSAQALQVIADKRAKARAAAEANPSAVKDAVHAVWSRIANTVAWCSVRWQLVRRGRPKTAPTDTETAVGTALVTVRDVVARDGTVLSSSTEFDNELPYYNDQQQQQQQQLAIMPAASETTQAAAAVMRTQKGHNDIV
jgi:hypothetical protein